MTAQFPRYPNTAVRHGLTDPRSSAAARPPARKALLNDRRSVKG